MRKLQLFAAVAMFFGVSCGSSRVAGGSTIDLAGTEWQIEQLAGEAIAEDVAVDADSFTLIFGEDGNIGGKAVCNRILGQYEQCWNGVLDIAYSGTTMMACPNLDFESKYTKVLDKATRFGVKGEGEKQILSLYNGEELLATFKAFN